MWTIKVHILIWALSFDLRLPFCDSTLLYTMPFVLEDQGLCKVYQWGDSKSNLILCLIPNWLRTTCWDSEQAWDISGWCFWPKVVIKCVLWENLHWIQKTTQAPPLRDTYKLTGSRSILLPQQKASHQGLDLITAQQGERPNRQQSCPPAFHPPASNAPCSLTLERASLTLHVSCLMMRGTECEGRDGQAEES